MTKQIQLTQGQVALVDDEDFEWLNQWKWFAVWEPNLETFYAARQIRISPTKQTHVKMSRFIMNTPPWLVVDHVNHNTLDNQKRNLRNVTTSQNGMNRRPNKNNTTGFRGVTKTRYNRFKAEVKLNGKKLYFGTYDTAEEAAKAYEKASDELYGEFKYK